jgi:hypothetical protein
MALTQHHWVSCLSSQAHLRVAGRSTGRSARSSTGRRLGRHWGCTRRGEPGPEPGEVLGSAGDELRRAGFNTGRAARGDERRSPALGRRS